MFENPLLAPLMRLARQGVGVVRDASSAGTAGGASPASAENKPPSNPLDPQYSLEERRVAHTLVLPRYSFLPEGLILDPGQVFFSRKLLCPDLGSTPVIQAVLFGNAPFLRAVAEACRGSEDVLVEHFVRERDASDVRALTYAKWGKNARVLEVIKSGTTRPLGRTSQATVVEVERRQRQSEELMQESLSGAGDKEGSRNRVETVMSSAYDTVQQQLKFLENARTAHPRVAPQTLFLGPPPPINFEANNCWLTDDSSDADLAKTLLVQALNGQGRTSTFNERSGQFLNAPCILVTAFAGARSCSVLSAFGSTLLPQLKQLANASHNPLPVLFTDKRERIFDALLQSMWTG